MSKKAKRKPKCSMCGKCCLELGCELYMTAGDYRRWKHQGRDDILSYTYVAPKLGGYGDLWFDPETEQELDRCPFLSEIDSGKFACVIQETKPKVCREFCCEWAYGVGKRGIPFRTEGGWSEKARQLGYGKPKKCNY